MSLQRGKTKIGISVSFGDCAKSAGTFDLDCAHCGKNERVARNQLAYLISIFGVVFGVPITVCMTSPPISHQCPDVQLPQLAPAPPRASCPFPGAGAARGAAARAGASPRGERGPRRAAL